MSVNTQLVIVDARERRDWLPEARSLFDAGQLGKVTGLTRVDKADLEEFLEHMKERRTATSRPAHDFLFSLDLAPPDLR